jgi:hypothetical protein
MVQLEKAPKEKGPEEVPPGDLMTGRVFRKRTAPSPVLTPRKVVCRTNVNPPKMNVAAETQRSAPK